MKASFGPVISLSLLLGIFSCGEKKQSDNTSRTFSLEIEDSIQVDYLGEMELIDYDPKTDKYLLAKDYSEEYLEVDDSGKILTHKSFTSDSKDAVGFVLGSGYLDGGVTILSETKGFLIFQDGNKTGEIEVPYQFIPYMIYPKLGAFKYGNKLYYPKPMTETLYELRKEGGKFYSTLYRRPIIEGLDLTSGDTISALSLPESSQLLNGQMHGMLFPVVGEMEKHVLLSTWVEPVIYVYNKVDGAIQYDRTVPIDIPEWVAYTPSELEDREGFYTQNNKRTNGNLVDFLEVGDYYIAVYKRGVEENKMPEKTEDQGKYALAIQMKNPFFAAVFDKEFNQLAVNVPFPATSSTPRVVNTTGELVVSKDASLSELEDDGVIIYKLKLLEK